MCGMLWMYRKAGMSGDDVVAAFKRGAGRHRGKCSRPKRSAYLRRLRRVRRSAASSTCLVAGVITSLGLLTPSRRGRRRRTSWRCSTQRRRTVDMPDRSALALLSVAMRKGEHNRKELGDHPEEWLEPKGIVILKLGRARLILSPFLSSPG